MKNTVKIYLQKLEMGVKAIRPRLIDAIGEAALEFVDDNFAKEAFQGETTDEWPERKRIDRKRPGRKILVDTAALRRSFKQTNYPDRARISTDDPKAQIHNEGGDITIPSRSAILNFKSKKGKLKLAKAGTETQQRKVSAIRRATIPSYTIHMPQRQFLGPSPVLTRACEKVVLKELITHLSKAI